MSSPREPPRHVIPSSLPVTATREESLTLGATREGILMVEAAEEGLRLDRFLVGRFPGLGRASAARWIRLGVVSVERPDERPLAGRKGTLLRAGDRLRLSEEGLGALAEAVEGAEDAAPLPGEVPGVEVVHADAQILVFHKPAGVPCHPLRPGERGTLANHLAALFPPLADLGGPRREAGLVHRLDTLTSGLVVAARTPEAHRHLRALFAEHRVEKTYLALVWGTPEPGFVVDLPIASLKGRRKVSVGHGGLPAVTHVRRLESCPPSGAQAQTTGHDSQLTSGLSLSLVEARTRFGRRHQVRAHLAHAGHPLVADPLYDVGGTARLSLPLPEGPWPLLFACGLALPHPGDGSPFTLSLPLPPEVREALDGLGCMAVASL